MTQRLSASVPVSVARDLARSYSRDHGLGYGSAQNIRYVQTSNMNMFVIFSLLTNVADVRVGSVQ